MAAAGPDDTVSVRAWLDSVRNGYAAKWASVFEETGFERLDDVRSCSDDELQACGGGVRGVAVSTPRSSVPDTAPAFVCRAGADVR